jgi:asparagine synthase (glutamine-hydrolysing)
MSDIAGYYNLENSNIMDKIAIKKMTDALSHRRPAGEGFYYNEKLVLGHRRLSIIDLNTGDQPMYD